MAKYNIDNDEAENMALQEAISAIKKILEKNTKASVDEIIRLLKWTDNGANRFIINMALKAMGK